MSREQAEYHSQTRSAAVGGLGCVGALIGIFVPITGLSTYGTGSVIYGIIIGFPIGFFLGVFVGLSLSVLVKLSPTGLANRAVLLERQLVGEMCIICRKRVASLVEGTFCQACGGAVHHACVRAEVSPVEGRCSRCGGDPSLKLPPDYHG
jgi:hypothetical protein